MGVSISVCMATYNGEKYIYHQIESIIKQLSINDELIISDDGSTDNTLKIVNSFNDKRIKIFYNQNKKGPVGNFQNALTKAKGDYIFLSDQDDIWIDNKLLKHLELMENYDLVISDAIVINDKNEVLFDSYFKERGVKKGFINNLLKNSYLGCNMSFRKSLLEKCLPFPKYIYMHDWWIGLLGELNGEIFFCEDRLLYYRRHVNAASTTLTNKLPVLIRLKNRLGFVIGIAHLTIKKRLKVNKFKLFNYLKKYV